MYNTRAEVNALAEAPIKARSFFLMMDDTAKSDPWDFDKTPASAEPDIFAGPAAIAVTPVLGSPR